MTGSQKYEKFLALHEGPEGFVMPNAWDGMSALILAEAGFEALGTSSAALAATLGRLDGRHAVSRQEHLEHAQLLGHLTDLPVNGDFEDGYGETGDDVAATVMGAINGGLAGIGIEDTSGNPADPIRAFDDAVGRVRAAVQAGRAQIVITGRADNYGHGRRDLDDTIRRLTAFAEVGADVLFAPYLSDVQSVRAVVAAVAPRPVNVVVSPTDKVLSVSELQAIGVKRISMGFALYGHAMAALEGAARALTGGDVEAAATGMTFKRFFGLLRQAKG